MGYENLDAKFILLDKLKYRLNKMYEGICKKSDKGVPHHSYHCTSD